MNSSGILGVALHLPPEIRRNDWWSPDTVAQWVATRGRPPMPDLATLPAGAQLVVEAMSKQALDPFQGAVERHVMGARASVFDMAEAACRDALARAGVLPEQVDVVLTHTIPSDVLYGNPACTVHRRLGIKPECFAMETEGSTYAFLEQLSLADSFIKAGKARYVLLVQACATSPLVDYSDPNSVVFGDGASAVVVGAVAPGHGLLGEVHYTDGTFPSPLVATVPARRWYDDGTVQFVVDQKQMGALLLQIADVIKLSVDAVLAKTSYSPKDVAFFCMHQGTPWLRKVVEQHCGLTNARSAETFSKTGYLFSAILPAGLHEGLRMQQLSEGDLVVLVAGGAGMSYGASLLRWGN